LDGVTRFSKELFMANKNGMMESWKNGLKLFHHSSFPSFQQYQGDIV
jgi:hypothetical protein